MRYTNYRFPVPEEKVIRLITDTDAKNEETTILPWYRRF